MPPQTADWKRHKGECRRLASLPSHNCRRVEVERELQRFPLAPRLPREPEDPAQRECGVCWRRDVALCRTDCCGAWVCATTNCTTLTGVPTDHRSFCFAAHETNTVCGRHYRMGHTGDWRVCTACPAELADYGYLAANGLNVTSGLYHPRGELLGIECATCRTRRMPHLFPTAVLSQKAARASKTGSGVTYTCALCEQQV